MAMNNSVVLNLLSGLILSGIVALHLSNGRFDLSTGLYSVTALILLAYGGNLLMKNSNQ